MLLWRICVADNAKTYFGIVAKCQIYLSDFKRIVSLDRYSQESAISSFTEICLVGAALDT